MEQSLSRQAEQSLSGPMEHGSARSKEQITALALSPEMAAFAQAVDALAATHPSLLCDAASVLEFGRLRARLDCIGSELAAEFDQWGEWARDGAQSAVAWLDTYRHAPKKEVRAELRRGKALPSMPLAAQAWAEGAIGAAQIDALLGVRTPVTEECFVRDEEMLVTQATELKFAALTRVLAYWEQHADPDGATASDMARQERRDAFLIQGIDGMWNGRMHLDPISGTIVASELSRLEKELFEADWAQAKEERGRDPKLHELGRSSAQRRADAFVEMATRSKTAPADGRRPEPLFSFLVGYETLHGRISQLSNATVLSPDSVLSWLDTAYFERAVFAPGKRIEVSVTSRFFTGATRRAIELRDRECTHATCDVPADDCQIDHIIDYSRGGPTEQENGWVACGFHNRLRYERPPPDRDERPPPDG
jgi:hypothetical protein